MKIWIVLASLLVFATACDTGSGGSAASGSSGSGSSSGAKMVAVGQPMTASDGKVVTVTAFKRSVIPANEFQRPGAGKECVQVSFSLSNGSKSEWLSPTSELSVVDTNGQKYDAYAFNCGSGDNVSSLVAGGKASPNEFFEVPNGIALNVTWKPNMFESAVYQTPLK